MQLYDLYVSNNNMDQFFASPSDATSPCGLLPDPWWPIEWSPNWSWTPRKCMENSGIMDGKMMFIYGKGGKTMKNIIELREKNLGYLWKIMGTLMENSEKIWDILEKLSILMSLCLLKPAIEGCFFGLVSLALQPASNHGV